MYADVIPDECTCKWVNLSDYTGWERKHRDAHCVHHGDRPPATEGKP